ncbi:MAG: hypothetical protein ACLTDF_08390 [Coprococcus sp.]
MTQKAINYGIVLYQLGISQDMVEEIKALVDENLELADALASPVVEHAESAKSLTEYLTDLAVRNLSIL